MVQCQASSAELKGTVGRPEFRAGAEADLARPGVWRGVVWFVTGMVGGMIGNLIG